LAAPVEPSPGPSIAKIRVVRAWSSVAIALVFLFGSGCGSVSSTRDGGSGGASAGTGGSIGGSSGQGGVGGVGTGQGGQGGGGHDGGGSGGSAGTAGSGGAMGGGGGSGVNLSCTSDSDCSWHTVGCCSEVCAASAPPPTVTCNIACRNPTTVCGCVDHQCVAESADGGQAGAGGTSGCGTCPNPTDYCTSCNTCCPRGALCVCPTGAAGNSG
jgi:hypothetical protein